MVTSWLAIAIGLAMVLLAIALLASLVDQRLQAEAVRAEVIRQILAPTESQSQFKTRLSSTSLPWLMTARVFRPSTTRKCL